MPELTVDLVERFYAILAIAALIGMLSDLGAARATV